MEIKIEAGPDVLFVSTGACNLEAPGSHPGQAGYLSSWLSIYSAPNCSKACSYSAVYGTVHYEEPLMTFEIKVVHTSGFGFLLSRYYPNVQKET